KVNSITHLFYLMYFLGKKNNKYSHIISTGPGLCFLLSRIKSILKLEFKIYGWPHFSSSSGNGDFLNFDYADKILCISNGIFCELKSLGIDSNKLTYFPNPFFNISTTNNSNGENNNS
ncbi:hypothetical protein, partial [Rosenbergiella collisarenosi]|uniref:hypothetical protein n=1 Tax=Rosenbergiella collisarenosi TaxID=1544695 RepID=UPI001F4E2449